MGETEFDRMLKGRFYQALLPKWQRKLGAPKLDESFTALYDRACMLEMHDQQYTAAAQARDGKAKGATHTEKARKPAELPKPIYQTQSSSGEGIGPLVAKNSDLQPRSKFSCWRCGETAIWQGIVKRSLVMLQGVLVRAHPVSKTRGQLLLKLLTLFKTWLMPSLRAYWQNEGVAVSSHY